MIIRSTCSIINNYGNFLITLWYLQNLNRIGGIMVSVLASSGVDRVFQSWSGQTKDYEIGICCFSVRYAALRRKRQTGWLGI
jgi:hypothetical protein